MENGKKIYSSMIAVMKDVSAITKDRKNTQQGYSFRGIDDVYNEVHDILGNNGVFMTTEVIDQKREDRTSKGGSCLIYSVITCRFTFFAEDGSSVQSVIIGEGMDSGDKATNKALSVAQKYCLLQAFCIPTADPKDPENDAPVPVARPVTCQNAPEPSKSDAAKNAPQEGMHYEPVDEPVPEQKLSIVGVIELVDVKTGKNKAGKDWTRYGVKINGTSYGTFDKNIGQQAQDLIGQEARIYYVMEGKYATIDAIEYPVLPF